MNPSENIVRMRLADLTPAPWNPRKKLSLIDKDYQDVKRSIENFGNVEIYIFNSRSGLLLSGHLRRQVELDMGIEEGDVRIVDLAPAQEQALNIALNKIGSSNDMWDFGKLKDIFEDLDIGIPDFPEVTGFDSAEIERLMTWTAEGEFPVPTVETPKEYDENIDTSKEEAKRIKCPGCGLEFIP